MCSALEGRLIAFEGCAKSGIYRLTDPDLHVPFRKEQEMAVSESWHPSEPPRPDTGTETAIWVMIVILLGLSCLALVALCIRAAG